MAGGSHNRKSSDSLKHVLESEGKLKLCKCPIHTTYKSIYHKSTHYSIYFNNIKNSFAFI